MKNLKYKMLSALLLSLFSANVSAQSDDFRGRRQASLISAESGEGSNDQGAL